MNHTVRVYYSPAAGYTVSLQTSSKTCESEMPIRTWTEDEYNKDFPGFEPVSTSTRLDWAQRRANNFAVKLAKQIGAELETEYIPAKQAMR